MRCCGGAVQGQPPTDQQVDDAVALMLPAALASEMPGIMEQALEDYTPGARLGKQEVANAFVIGANAYPGTSLPGLSIPVLGNGRDVDLLLFVPSVYANAADALVTFIVYVDGAPLDLSATLSSVRLGVAGADGGRAFVLPLTVNVPAGVTKTYSIGAYSSAEMTFNAVPFAKIQYTATRA